MRMPWASKTRLIRWLRGFGVGLAVAVVLRLVTHLLSVWFYDWHYVRGAMVWDGVHDGMGMVLGAATGVETTAVVVCSWTLAALLIMGRVKKYKVLDQVFARSAAERRSHRHRKGHRLHRPDLRRGLRPESRTRI